MELESNFGAAKLVIGSRRSKHGIVQCVSRKYPGAIIEFAFKDNLKKNNAVKYYYCIGCKRQSEQSKRQGNGCSSIALLTVKDSRVVTDPDEPNTPHSCKPQKDNASLIVAKRVMYHVRTAVRDSKKRPREAFDDALNMVSEFTSGTGVDAGDVNTHICGGLGLNSKRRALSRNRNHDIPRHVDVENLPSELQMTVDNAELLREVGNEKDKEYMVFLRTRVLKLSALKIETKYSSQMGIASIILSHLSILVSYIRCMP